MIFRALHEAKPGKKWRELFRAYWPAYRKWFEAASCGPDYKTCRKALREHMPELVPVHDRLRRLVGADETMSRFLSFYCPPAYAVACSQAVWPGPEPLLVRNYDYRPDCFDAIVLGTGWGGKQVVGVTDCLFGLLDGINEDGLAVSLTFGGRSAVGEGFAIPLILRYILQTCTTAAEAAEVLVRIPSHMAYNVTALDEHGGRATVSVGPDREAEVTDAPVATNHQRGYEEEARSRAADTQHREDFLLGQLFEQRPDQQAFCAAFLAPPLRSRAFSRGFGTLYTAAYRPRDRSMELMWPGTSWAFPAGKFEDGHRIAVYPDAA
ncbi:MAG: C45 family peptidase [Pseudomonadota bacterium]|nr:C45 family peptidase [Pseudomonadota bacterium]